MANQRTQMLSQVKNRERSILKNVYLWMTAGLALTGVISYLVATNETLMRIFLGSWVSLIFVIIAQFALVFYLTARLEKMSSTAAMAAFMGYSILTGITLSVIFLAYSGLVISRAFFTTAAAFGGMSLYGMTTKRDLDGIGHYLIMGLWGIIIASLINMLLGSANIYYLISIIGVLVFLGLTAWDTQKIKRMNDAYGSHMDEDTYIKLSIIGALILYLDFINIFLFLLRIFGRNNR
ncbi:MAG: Bax inhibitor-1/YccA family protein [Sphaerochaetaceae bacterium]|jgi:FtsH-binding integral membrane protein|nr:Bax inhibitor-1/YccA family protein [Sphaerochaetaceae bacterium]MDD3366376.1 Bax inhibitor-1/YccA family protein [Sphaerochaetaceae bacterium]MDD4218975.1 Bax inhibitor-1/YccA family protein [Sphaerochaetaceae bacterium]MDY0371488.1 Bax inhibitor-1/YccA family protein [Sphaerochaetaceae bacterium]